MKRSPMSPMSAADWIATARFIESLIPAPWFMGVPDRWLNDPHWRCEEGHVSTRVLRSEARGGDCCLAASCDHARVRITFPEDTE